MYGATHYTAISKITLLLAPSQTHGQTWNRSKTYILATTIWQAHSLPSSPKWHRCSLCMYSADVCKISWCSFSLCSYLDNNALNGFLPANLGSASSLVQLWVNKLPVHTHNGMLTLLLETSRTIISSAIFLPLSATWQICNPCKL